MLTNQLIKDITALLYRLGVLPVSGGSGVTDGDKGDITVSSSGVTWTIDADAVSYAKLQNVSAASKLLGRGDSGSGDPQEITLGSGLTMTGTTLAASAGGGVSDGDKGDITVSSSGTVWTIDQAGGKYQSFSADTTVTTAEDDTWFEFTGSNKTITLPLASTKPGMQLGIVHQGSGTLTISATGGTVDGSSLYLSQSQGVIVKASSSTNWIVAGAFKYPGTTFASTADVLSGTNAFIFVPPSAVTALWAKGSDIASASTLTIGDGGSYYNVTGTTTINALSTTITYMTGREIELVFSGALQLTNSANLILPTGANITTAAGDTARFRLDTATPTNIWRCVSYQRASGAPLSGGGGGGGSPSFTTVEKNISSFPKKSGSFTITGLSGLTLGKPVHIFQATGSYTGKGSRADESEMDGLTINAVVTASDTITAYWNVATFVKGNFKFNYLVGA